MSGDCAWAELCSQLQSCTHLSLVKIGTSQEQKF